MTPEEINHIQNQFNRINELIERLALSLVKTNKKLAEVSRDIEILSRINR